jgi:hypothetical protein
MMDPLEAHLQRQIEHSRDFFWHRVRWKAVAGELDGGPFVLTDVGAGIGLVGDYLAAEHPRSTYRFAEPLDSLVSELESRFGAAANANAEDSYRGSRYVTLLDVLEHIEDDRRFLSELTAKMDVGATLILTVPALRRLWSGWDVALGHFRRYDKAMLRALFAGLPVTVREVSYLFPEMLLPALLRRRSSSAADGGTAQSAEFPDLSPTVNQLLYGVGSGTLRLRRYWPAGTSLLTIVDRV